MAQFDVWRLADGSGFVIECQTDLLDHIDSRFVAPLAPPDIAPPAVRRLNPVVEIEGVRYVMMTQSAAAIRRRDLGQVVMSLADRRHEIIDAFDFLLTGV